MGILINLTWLDSLIVTPVTETLLQFKITPPLQHQVITSPEDKTLYIPEFAVLKKISNAVLHVVKISGTGGRSETEPKYRNDENVLASLPAQFRQITIDIQNTPPRMVRINLNV